MRSGVTVAVSAGRDGMSRSEGRPEGSTLCSQQFSLLSGGERGVGARGRCCEVFVFCYASRLDLHVRIPKGAGIACCVDEIILAVYRK